jgi:hypothetical protein
MIGLHEGNPGQAVYYEVEEKSVDVWNLITCVDSQSFSTLTHGGHD